MDRPRTTHDTNQAAHRSASSPSLLVLSPTLGEDTFTATSFLTKLRTGKHKQAKKMPTSKPNKLPKIENLRSILHTPQYNSNNIIYISRNSPRDLPFCVHGDLSGRYPGASYNCRSDHRSRTPTPATTPHSKRSRNSLRKFEGPTARRGSWTNDDHKAKDFFYFDREEENEG